MYAHCHAVKRLLETEFGVKSQILLRHGERPKWKNGGQGLKSCFPFFRSLNFGEANTPLFEQRQQEQSELFLQLGFNDSDFISQTFGPYPPSPTRFLPRDVVIDALGRFANFTTQNGVDVSHHPAATKNDTAAAASVSPGPKEEPSANISVPFLYVMWMYMSDWVKDDYMDEFRHLFAFETTATTCCGILPDADETVFVRCCGS
jgi:hypothetical protein